MAGLTEAPAAPLHHWPPPQAPLAAVPSGCSPEWGPDGLWAGPRCGGGGGGPGQGRNRKCISLGSVVTKGRHRSPPPHGRRRLLFRTSSPFLCLYLLWRWLRTRPWLPAGPEAEVTSLFERTVGMEKYSQPPSSSPSKHKGFPSGSPWILKSC